MFMAMKRRVLELGGYAREFFVSQTPELTAMADAVIDLEAMRATCCACEPTPQPRSVMSGAQGMAVEPTTRPTGT
jgi:hypothetical protein